MRLLANKPTREQKRLNMFVGRYNAAPTEQDKLRIATDYLRTVCHGMEGDALHRVAWQLFEFAAKVDGIDLSTQFAGHSR